MNISNAVRNFCSCVIDYMTNKNMDTIATITTAATNFYPLFLVIEYLLHFAFFINGLISTNVHKPYERIGYRLCRCVQHVNNVTHVSSLYLPMCMPPHSVLSKFQSENTQKKKGKLFTLELKRVVVVVVKVPYERYVFGR